MQRPEAALPDAASRTVLFITYTMANPHAVGVFFRALRLAFEFRRRGWRFIVGNTGPVPEDPKVDRARELGQIWSFGGPDGARNRRDTFEMVRTTAPELVVFGERPFPGMEPFYAGARLSGCPVAVLDQFYDPNVTRERWGVDRLVLYGAKCLWKEELKWSRRYVVVPPFIEEVAPAASLPGMASLRGRPFVSILGLDERVLRGGIELLARLGPQRPAVVSISRDPELAATLMDGAGIRPEERLCLPLQPDAALFGWMAASRVVILANGFMQMLEALVLGRPALCIDRGIGMPGWSLHERYWPFISNGEPDEVQLGRLRSWLERSPFPPGVLAQLQQARNGCRECVDELERIAARRSLRPRLERSLSRLDAALRGNLRAPRGDGTHGAIDAS